MANIGMILYALIGVLVFLYFVIEGWLSGNPLELVGKTVVGAVLGYWWLAVLIAFITWAVLEIIFYYVVERKRT